MFENAAPIAVSFALGCAAALVARRLWSRWADATPEMVALNMRRRGEKCRFECETSDGKKLAGDFKIGDFRGVAYGKRGVHVLFHVKEEETLARSTFVVQVDRTSILFAQSMLDDFARVAFGHATLTWKARQLSVDVSGTPPANENVAVMQSDG